MAETLTKKVYAKINLGLDITGKRADGYHELRSVMQTVDLWDELTLTKTDAPGISLKTNLSWLPTDGRNLMVRAAEEIFAAYHLPGGLSMELEKHIPVGGGMAGGSTDAAGVINAMDALYGLKLSAEEKETIALKLGADVTFCLYGGTMLCEGIGEKLTKLPDCPPFYAILVKPPFSVSTKDVYAKYDTMTEKGDAPVHPDTDAQCAALQRSDTEAVMALSGNVLEPVTFSDHPTLPEIARYLLEKGAFRALMSGSGPTMLGFYLDREKALSALSAVRRKYRSSMVKLVSPVNDISE